MSKMKNVGYQCVEDANRQTPIDNAKYAKRKQNSTDSRASNKN